MTFRAFTVILAAAAGGSVLAQSGIFAGPFAANSGTYTTLPGGTFELDDPLGNWSDFSGFSSLSRSQASSMRGDYVGLMTGNPAPGFARNNLNYAPLVGGEEYVLSGFFRAEDIGGNIGIDILFQGGFTQIASQFLTIDETTVGKWHFAYTTFTAPVQPTYVRIVRNGGPFGSTNYFDDIALTHASEFVAPSPVPEPGTILALSAGLGLVLRRRRSS